MKNPFSTLGYSVLLLVLVASAEITHAATAPATASTGGSINTAPITNFSLSLIGLLNTVVVPLVFALAFIVFIWGIFQAFILNGANDEKRKEGAKFAMWAVIGFVVMISIWGIVNIAKTILPTGENIRPDFPCFDKDPSKCNPTTTP